MPCTDPPAPPLANTPARDDAMLGGRLQLLQPTRGYRAGLDAGLLAAAVGARPGERTIEIGCGVGAALLQAASRAPAASFVGVERDPAALALAQANLARNDLTEQVSVMAGDVAPGFPVLRLERFDAAFANPPFFDDPDSLRGPAPERRGAWLADAGLAAWVQFLVAAVRDGGRITLIHRTDRLADILAALATHAGSVRIRPVHAFADRPAKRVLIRAVRGGRAPLVLLAPLILHETAPDGAVVATERHRSLLRGDAELHWGEAQPR